jgi:hypothetical protein
LGSLSLSIGIPLKIIQSTNLYYRTHSRFDAFQFEFFNFDWSSIALSGVHMRDTLVRIVFSYGAENVRAGFPSAPKSSALKISKWHFTESNFGLPQAPAKMTPRRRRPSSPAELNETSVARALHYPPVVNGDGGINQIATERPQPRQCPILVGASEPAVSGHIRRKNGCEFPGLRHGSTLYASQSSTIIL